MAAFQQGLADRRYVEGKTVEYEHLWANEQCNRLPDMSAQLVARRADLIVTTNVPASARAAMNAARDIPIEFAPNSVPVEAGLVASLAKPGGNVTGVSYLAAALSAEWLEMLLIGAEVAPRREC